MSADLYQRLELLKRIRGGAAGGERAGASRSPRGAGPGGGQAPGLSGFVAAEAGVCFRVVREPAPKLAELLERGSPLLPSGFGRENLRFFDLETTGLSGGAGTKVFLAGVAFLEERELVLEQWLLTEYGAESAFLELIAERFPQDALYVSYNGKAFDAHQLKTRFLMHRRQHVLRYHLDLLYPARRLWRSLLPSCGLSELERQVLEIEREDDLPSFEVPERYFEFLDRRDPALLAPVVAHHYHDILSLSALLLTIHEVFSDPLGCLERGRPRFDTLQAALWMLRRSSADRLDAAADEGGTAVLRRNAERLLSTLLSEGGANSEELARAALVLGAEWKRAGRYSDAEALYRSALNASCDPRLAVELAKILEHQRGAVGEALELVESADSARCSRALRAELEHRGARLRRKLARAAD